MTFDRRIFIAAAILTGIFLAACAQPHSARAEAPPATAPAARTPLTFPDAIALTNPLIRVEVAPSVGRITHFGFADGQNLFWINTPAGAEKGPQRNGELYRNIGGDKLWPAMQDLWTRIYGPPAGWPPDGVIDGKPWTLIEKTDHKVIMQSPPQEALGIIVQRQITLDPDQPVVTITNTITRQKPNLFPVHIWTISQAIWPDYVLMDVAADRPAPAKRIYFPRSLDDIMQDIGDNAQRLQIDPNRKGGSKVGTLGRWLAAVSADHIWYQATQFDPAGMYLDASNVQVYFDGNYTELELLSPSKHLLPGESLTNTVLWRLTPRGDLTDEQIVEQARQLAATVK